MEDKSFIKNIISTMYQIYGLVHLNIMNFSTKIYSGISLNLQVTTGNLFIIADCNSASKYSYFSGRAIAVFPFLRGKMKIIQ